MGHGQRVQFKKVIYRLHLSSASIPCWPGKAVYVHCPTQRACACMYQHLCMNRRKAGLDFAPSEFTGASTFLWCRTDSHHTHTTGCGVQLLCSRKKKDRKSCSLLCVPLCTLTQSMKRGLGKSLLAHTQTYNSFKYKHFQSRLKNASGSVSTTLSKAMSHSLRFF